MAAHALHPISAPPAAPIREKFGHLLVRAWCIFVLVAGFAGTSWLMAFGVAGTAVVAYGSGLISMILWIVLRPGVQWRRLPWLAVGYVAWATCSILWSAYPASTVPTLLLLLSTTVQAMFVGSVLTWRELVRSIASALKWVLGVSLAFEIWVSLVWGGPVMPGFGRPGRGVDPIEMWSRDNLFDGGRIQGVFGNANALAYVALLGIVVFSIRIASRAPRRPFLYAWIVVAAFLFFRAASATATLAAAAVAVVLAAALIMRASRRAGVRTRLHLAYAVIALGGLGALCVARDGVFALLGRSSDLSGRERIWEAVGDRAAERPVQGWGFSTPWIPTDPAFDGWIVDHGVTVMQAHNMWLDVFLQLGVIGVSLMALTVFAFGWRAWFFAIDRPRSDFVADRRYSALTLLPPLVAALLLVQGLAESTPLLGWGWMLLVMFSFKIKQTPLLSRGPAEQRPVGEQGERLPT